MKMSSTNETIEAADAAIRQGDFGRAEAILAKINAEPARQTLPSLLLHSHTLGAQQKIPEAVAVLETAESRTRNPLEKAEILNRAADLLCNQPETPRINIERAIGFLERSVTLVARSNNAVIRKNLCVLYYRLVDFKSVARHAKLLLKVPEFSVQANLWLAEACFHFDERKKGARHLEKASAHANKLNEADLQWLLGVLMNYGLHSQVQEIINTAVSAGRQNPALVRTQAQLSYKARDYEQALEILSDEFISSHNQNMELTQSDFNLRGRCLDAMGRYVDAHKNFVAMNKVARRSYPTTPGKDTAAAYAKVNLASLPKHDIPETIPYCPAFMVGFPRSGTTLLDTILDTQDEITTLSEVAGLMAARDVMTTAGRDYPEDLSLLTEQDVDQLRNAYFAHNAQYLKPNNSYQVLIDKLPLNILHIPFIKILFPNARFIFSLRHPLDVCLSCFQQGFLLNVEMLHFTDLEATFTRYRDVMNLFECFQSSGELNLLTVRYEDLVENFEATADEVFNFLNITPNESYKKFHEINKDKLLATPSSSQVVKPIYQSSRYRWHNYAEFLQPHIKIVQPFIDKFGYSTT